VVLAALASAFAGLHPPASAGMGWTLEVADGAPWTGRYNSLALGPDGWPRISYLEELSGDLRYAWRDASGWHNTTVDPYTPGSHSAGWGSSLAIDAAGIPHISYVAANISEERSAWYAFWNTSASSWTREFVGSMSMGFPADFGGTSIALNASGSPGVAYYHYGTGDLGYATRSAGSWSTEVVDTPGYTDHPPSLKLDSQGRPHVAYVTYPDWDLRHAWWDGSAWRLETVDATGYGSYYPSLALDSSDRPRIAYEHDTGAGRGLRYAAWDGAAWSVSDVDSVALSGGSPSLALNASDAPRIAYVRLTASELWFARWGAAGWRLELVDRGAAFETGLALDAADVAHISYYGAIGPAVAYLRYARGVYVNDPPASTASVTSPYWRRTASATITAAATDPDGSVARVDLYARFDGGAGFGPWTFRASDTVPPWQWSFPFPQGPGRYEFYSLAYDGTDFESKAPAAEASLGYDPTPPISQAFLAGPYWKTAPAAVTATAADALSGVASVTLRYRHAPDNASWGSWTDSGTLSAPPWQWTFPFPDGTGYYEFHAAAADVAGNLEPKTWPEAYAGYRPALPPRNLTTEWGAGSVRVSWEPPPSLPDEILIYRADSPFFTDLADNSPDLAARLGGATTSWNDPVPLAVPGEAYYAARAAYGSDLSPTSNTAGVFAGTLNAGLTAISRPLEYFPWVDYAAPGQDDTLAEYTAVFGATSIEYLDAAGRWRAGTSQRMTVGNAYLVSRTLPGTFAFTGLPGSQIRYDDGPSAGFTLAEARSLAATVAGDDVTLTWTAPAAMAGIASLEVWHGTARTAIFDGTAAPLASVPTATTTFTHAGALLGGDEHYYWIVPRDLSGELVASTYSVGVWAKTFRTHDTLALPLRPVVPRAVSWYADAVPGTLGILSLTANGAWVPHLTAMPAGVYDAPVAVGSGVQISMRSAVPVRYVFVGG